MSPPDAADPAAGRAGSGAPPARKLGLAVASFVFLADQAAKLWIMDAIRLEERVSLQLLPVLNLTWVENRGVSMGLLDLGDDGRWALTALTMLIAATVALWLWRERHRPEAVALGLVLGGAAGNILDRVRHGYVVDFVDLHWRDLHFYVFNVADAAITIGVGLLLLRGLFAKPAAAPTLESER